MKDNFKKFLEELKDILTQVFVALVMIGCIVVVFGLFDILLQSVEEENPVENTTIITELPTETIEETIESTVEETEELPTETIEETIESTVEETIDVSDLPEETINQINWTMSPYKFSTKTYMDYRAITSVNSKQYKLIHEKLTICEDGIIRDSEGYMAVALGSYFGEIGSRWVFLLDSGTELRVIKADAKSDIHTDSTNIYGSANKDIIEFIVDSTVMWKAPNGYIHYGNFNRIPEFKGAVVAWYRVD